MDNMPDIDPELLRRLEDDILGRGVIVPIVKDLQGNVIDGRIRQAIAAKHGLQCPVIFASDHGDDLRFAINTYRRQMSRQQIREVIAWELAKEPNASDRKIAGKIGVDNKTVASVRAKSTGEVPQLRIGLDGKTRRLPTVVYPSTPLIARTTQALLGQVKELPEGVVTPRQLRVQAYKESRAAKSSVPSAKLPASLTVRPGDFMKLDWKPYEGKTSLVLVDPPWLSDWKSNRESLARLAARLLRPGGVLAIYPGLYDLPDWLAVLGQHLTYRWQIAALNEGGGSVRVNGHRGQIVTKWRPILIYSKGEIHNETVLNDVMRSEKAKDWHDWEQPVSESVQLVRTYSDPGALIIDPCMGSGTTLAGVLLAGQGRTAVGCDVDPSAVQIARSRLADMAKRPKDKHHR